MVVITLGIFLLIVIVLFAYFFSQTSVLAVPAIAVPVGEIPTETVVEEIVPHGTVLTAPIAEFDDPTAPIPRELMLAAN